MFVRCINCCLSVFFQICLFQITSDSLFFSYSLSRQECRILSISWHPDSHTIAAGGNDSTIRLLDLATKRCTQRITLDDIQDSSTLVWSVKFLDNSTVASADSQGKIQIWDSRFGTLKQSLRCYLADVLALELYGEDIFYASGIDQKMMKFQKLKEQNGKWVRNGEARVHTHDVRSIAVAPNGHIVSGGVDTRLVVYDPAILDPYSTAQYSPFTVLSSRVHIAPACGVLMAQTNTSLKFWNLSSSLKEKPSCFSASALGNGKGVPVHFLEMKVPGHHHILSSALSPDATFAAVCNVECTWVYQLQSDVLCLGSWPVPAFKLCFNFHGSELALACIHNGLEVLRIAEDKKEKHFVNVLSHGKENHPKVVDLQYSPDDAYLASMTASNRILVYSTSTYQQIASIPRLDDTHMSRFCFSSDNMCIVAYTPEDRELFKYNLKTLQLYSLGCLNYGISKKTRGSPFLSPPFRILPLAGKTDVFALHDTNNLVFVQCNGDKPKIPSSNSSNKRKKTQRHLLTQLVSSYKEMLVVSVLSSGDMVVVEKPWTDILSVLPPALVRNRYGT